MNDILLLSANPVTQTAGPLLALLVVIGVVIGLIQATFQLQDASIGFVPKLAALMGAIAFGGPWLVERFAFLMKTSFAVLGAGH